MHTVENVVWALPLKTDRIVGHVDYFIFEAYSHKAGI